MPNMSVMPDSSRPQQAPQRVIKTRREYNIWVADESIEDYALRYAPTSVRKWSPWTVTNTAISTVSFLAMEAIGAEHPKVVRACRPLLGQALTGLDRIAPGRQVEP